VSPRWASAPKRSCIDSTRAPTARRGARLRSPPFYVFSTLRISGYFIVTHLDDKDVSRRGASRSAQTCAWNRPDDKYAEVRIRPRSLLRIAGPSVAERSRAGCKEQRSAEYWTYSSERRRSRRPGSAHHATPGGYPQQAPSLHNLQFDLHRCQQYSTKPLHISHDFRAGRTYLLAAKFEETGAFWTTASYIKSEITIVADDAPSNVETVPGKGTGYTAAGGTVYDAKTKLTWQQTVSSSMYTWADAKTYCAGVGTSLGGTGWRLPREQEMTATPARQTRECTPE
jgi:hypothetical protein